MISFPHNLYAQNHHSYGRPAPEHAQACVYILSSVKIGPRTAYFVRATTQHTLECPHERSKACRDVARTFA